MESNFISARMDGLKRKYPILQKEQEYHTFIYLCIRYFFYYEAGLHYDPEVLEECVTDGKDDGGIDAVFNDPTSDSNDVVILQSKFYEKAELSEELVTAEMIKISETIEDIENHRVSQYSEKVVSAFRNAKSNMNEGGEIRIVFCSSFQPKDKRVRNKIEKTVRKYFKSYDIDFEFRDDIEAQIELVDNGKLYVENDKLIIDYKDNKLIYEDSVIVNVSAKSLQELYNRRRNGLLGMNLRYYVRQKAVDTGIEKTIAKEPDNFWYKNNGLVILCQDYDIDGNELKLEMFSIVNGGQTTNRIGKADIESDFFIPCKVIKTKGKTQTDQDKFANSIAESSNSQKKISTEDLKSGTIEQARLKERLAGQHVYYVTKKGDKVPKVYSEPYQSASLKKVGSLSLAGVLQMPGTARNNPGTKIFQDEYYYSIYGIDANEKVIADLLRMEYYYAQFLKRNLKDRGYDETTVIPMMKNGRTFQLACITFLMKVEQGVFDYAGISGLLSNADELIPILRKMDGMDRIIMSNLDDEQETFNKLFDVIGNDVLGECFANAIDNNEGESVDASNYLKSDYNYRKYILKKLWRVYHRDEEFREAILRLAGKC